MKERMDCRAAWKLAAFGESHALYMQEDWAIKLKET